MYGGLNISGSRFEEDHKSFLGSILPIVVRSSERFDDDIRVKLHPTELAAITNASEGRRREFASVRGCARRALGDLGVFPSPIVPGPNREPQWPHGVVGSMTHCAGYRAAAVAYAHQVLTIGIDAEPHERLPSGTLAMVALPEELSDLRLLTRDYAGVHWDRILFSAKESVYKAWFPIARRWLGFSDALVKLQPNGVFLARFLIPSDPRSSHLTSFAGMWCVRDGFVLTSVVAFSPESNSTV